MDGLLTKDQVGALRKALLEHLPAAEKATGVSAAELVRTSVFLKVLDAADLARDLLVETGLEADVDAGRDPLEAARSFRRDANRWCDDSVALARIREAASPEALRDWSEGSLGEALVPLAKAVLRQVEP